MTLRITHYPAGLPLPPALAAAPKEQHPAHGVIIRSIHVAEAFKVEHATLRQWRKIGDFPDALPRIGKASYYALDAALIGHYYRRNPGALPDPEDSDAPLFSRRPRDTGDQGHDALAVEAQEIESEPRHLTVKARETGLTQSVRTELVSVVLDAVARMVERSPEAPAVIEALAAELVAQRNTIEQQREEIERLRRDAKKGIWSRFLGR